MDLYRFCQDQLEWVVHLVRSLAELESPSTDKAAVDRCGAEIARRFAGLGGRVTWLPREERGDLLRADFGDGGPEGAITLLGHFDTVWPVGQLATMPLRVEDGRLYGPGVFDMKGGIAIGLLAVRALVETGAPPGRRVTFLLTTDEEIGSHASRREIEDQARRSEAVLVLEPGLPGGGVKTRRKGCGEFRVHAVGVAAHAGVDPAAGASAVHELARQVGRIEQLQDLTRGISVNVGLITGGTRANVVAPEATAIVDARAPSLEAAREVTAGLLALRPVDPRVRLEVTGGFERPPLERHAGVARLYEQARLVAEALGRVLDEGGTGGGSDGNFTAALGVPTLDGLGVTGGGAHALHEHLEVGDLPWRAALLAGLLARIGAR